MDLGFGLFLLLLMSCACFGVLLTLLCQLFPDAVTRSAEYAADRHGRSVLLGFLNALLVLALAAVLAMIGERVGFPFFIILGGGLLLVLIVGLLLGLSGSALLIGRKIKPASDEQLQSLWGSGAIILAALTPYLGWFLFFPYILFRGLGGFVMAVSAIRREGKLHKEKAEGS